MGLMNKGSSLLGRFHLVRAAEQGRCAGGAVSAHTLWAAAGAMAAVQQLQVMDGHMLQARGARTAW